MATWGHFRVRASGFRTRHMFTSHDGHLDQLVRDLVEMPFLLFDLSTEVALKLKTGATAPEHRFRLGPYFMQIMLAYVLDDPPQPPKDHTLKDVRRAMSAGLLFEVSPYHVVEWMTAAWFSRWRVALDKRELGYGKECDLDVVVADNTRTGAYVVRPVSDYAINYFDQYAKAAVERVAARQACVAEDERVRFACGRIVVPAWCVVTSLVWDYLSNRRWEVPGAEGTKP